MRKRRWARFFPHCGQELLGRGLAALGRLVARRPLPFAVLPLLLALLSCAGLLRFRLTKQFDLLFVPQDSPSTRELKAHDRFPQLQSHLPVWMDSGVGESDWLPAETCDDPRIGQSSLVVFVSRQDHSNVLDSHTLRFLHNLSSNFTHRFRVRSLDRSLTFRRDFCAPCQHHRHYCDRNEWLLSAAAIFAPRLRHSPNIQFNFPLLQLFGQTLDLSPFFLGANFSEQRREATSVILHYSIFYEKDRVTLADLAAMRAAYEAYWTNLKGFVLLLFFFNPLPCLKCISSSCHCTKSSPSDYTNGSTHGQNMCQQPLGVRLRRQNVRGLLTLF